MIKLQFQRKKKSASARTQFSAKFGTAILGTVYGRLRRGEGGGGKEDGEEQHRKSFLKRLETAKEEMAKLEASTVQNRKQARKSH